MATQQTALGLSAVIVAVTNEVPRVLAVRRLTHELATPMQRDGLPVAGESALALPFGPFQPDRHRTLELGLRGWVEELTGLRLRYVEQLYTFGDRFRDPRERVGGPRVVSVGYLALVHEAPPTGSGEAEWCDWYDFFPWEDWRQGRPPVIERTVRPRLEGWVADAADDRQRRERAGRVALCFGAGDEQWDIERTLDRYELLYEARLIPEAARDGCPHPVDTEAARLLGRLMALDNRRILATAMGRLRGKLRYRPVVFDLLPPSFTLLKLQRVVEALSGKRLHKQNFRRLLQAGGLVEPTGRFEAAGRGRPAELFRFRREVLHERVAPGVGIPAVRVGG